MKAFISIDMEGICGVVREIETHPTKGGEAYQQSRRLMTQEGNAAIEGCLKAGATEVLMADSHWNFDNLIPEELHEAATLLRGTPRGFAMMQDLDGSYDAALFIGYHARAGTPRAILDHTYSGTIAGVRVNGTEEGENGDQRVPGRPSWSPRGPCNGRLGRDRGSEGIESERAHGRGEGRDGGHVGEESAPEEGPGTDSGRGDQSGPGSEDDPGPSREDPRPNGCRVPRHLCSRPRCHDPHRPPGRRIAARVRNNRLRRGVPALLRHGHHCRRRVSRLLQMLLTNTYIARDFIRGRREGTWPWRRRRPRGMTGSPPWTRNSRRRLGKSSRTSESRTSLGSSSTRP